ncbi:MAG: efflux RND transporter permease subunit, partial [Pseudomonadota bacterium]
MNLIRVAIERPIAVIAAVLMVVIFGYVSLLTIPIQLAPDVSKPVISVTTRWPGAAPAEIEREIVNKQEDAFKGLEGLETISSSSEDGRGRITLEFSLDANMDRALLLVANRLDRVSDYPDEADEPGLSTSGSEDNPIAWFVITREAGNDRLIHTYGDFAEDVIEDRLERVDGVSEAEVLGGSTRELQIIVLPEEMARYRLTVSDIADSLRAAGVSMTAGDVEEGKRRYVVRTEGDFERPDQVADVVLRSIEDEESGRLGRVTIADIADVQFGYSDAPSYIRVLGERALVARAMRETGANVIETMKGIRGAVTELNQYQLPNAGLKMQQVYDETVYINSSIDLVTQNIYVGGVLAAIILLLFLRSFGATLIISVAIPVSVVASFVAMAAMGRSINVVSLAGIAFAVGMVVDAAIVVLENIYRLRQEGKSRVEAAYQGAAQVWGAILVSALTTVMVFIPILVMKLEVGQLFRDIAVAISVAVLMSLLVAVTVIPAMSNRFLGGRNDDSITRIRLPVIDELAAAFAAAIMGFTRAVVKSRMLSLLVVVIVTGSAGTLAYKFLPKLEYLPEGNQNLVFGFLVPPPGYNLDTMATIAQDVELATQPLWSSVTGAESAPGEPPKIDRFFFAAFRGNVIFGASSMDAQRAGELIEPIRQPIFREPGTFGFIRQPSIFGRGIGGARSIDLDISGPDLEQVLEVALRTAGRVGDIMPQSEGNQMRPRPGLELGAPEVRLTPDRVRLADAGVTARNFALSVDAF